MTAEKGKRDIWLDDIMYRIPWPAPVGDGAPVRLPSGEIVEIAWNQGHEARPFLRRRTAETGRKLEEYEKAIRDQTPVEAELVVW